MSLHDDINQTLRKQLDELEGVIGIRPDTLALRALATFGGDSAEAHIRYGCTEHFKQMARRLLANRFEADGAENEAHQGDMFSGHLQQRYPIQRGPDEEPEYRLRETLNVTELDWNINQLRKSADARLRHADALQSYRDLKAVAASRDGVRRGRCRWGEPQGHA